MATFVTIILTTHFVNPVHFSFFDLMFDINLFDKSFLRGGIQNHFSSVNKVRVVLMIILHLSTEFIGAYEKTMHRTWLKGKLCLSWWDYSKLKNMPTYQRKKCSKMKSKTLLKLKINKIQSRIVIDCYWKR